MPYGTHRITLVSSGTRAAARNWQLSTRTPSRVIRLESLTMLKHALAGVGVELHADVERVILDRCGAASDYLNLLATLPQHFAGDVVMICSDGKAFLSTTDRGGNRTLYTLTDPDLAFYFEAHRLVKSKHSQDTLQAMLANPSSVWMRAAA